MGLLSRLRAPRWLGAQESRGAPVADPSPPRRAGADCRNAVAQAAATVRVLGNLTTLEQRYGAGVGAAAVRLRSAVLLHRAGRKDEAWAAFGRLLADPELGGAPSLRPIMESEIYARMRLALEREGCHNAAITPAVLSYATRAQSCALQERQADLDMLRSAASFERYVKPLLARARLASTLPPLLALVEGHLRALPELDVAALRTALKALLENPPNAAALRQSRAGPARQR